MCRVRRDQLIRDVRARLAGRKLVYFGTRGWDAEGVGDVPELSAVFSIVGASDRRAHVQTLALEQLTGHRVDLDAHDIDDDLATAEVRELRRTMLRVLHDESVVFTYRPSTFLSAVCFARERATYAGLFKDHQAAFEHKPWVESSIAALGVPSIPWIYIADEDQIDATRLLADGAVMVRRSRSSGGTGLVRVDSIDDVRELWPDQAESFASVSPYLENGIPTNVGGVVWQDIVTLHPPSVQLIGIPQLTDRPFGYCGNDFGAVRGFDVDIVEKMEAGARVAGEWLRGRGYLGAFGVDFLVVDGQPLFTEINARLQGATHLSCQLSSSKGESCIMLEHLAASLGLSGQPSAPLREQVAEAPSLSHFVYHKMELSTDSSREELLMDHVSRLPGLMRLDMALPRGVTADHGATLLRATFGTTVTSTGLSLLPEWDRHLNAFATTGADA
jgi:hypothetical protein